MAFEARVRAAVAGLSAAQEGILLLAAAGGTHVPGREWLQMLMYYMPEQFGEPGSDAGYVPGPMGPYSAAVDASLEGLLRAGLLAEVAGSIFPTLGGIMAARELEPGKGDGIMQHVRECKDFAGGMNRDELLLYACRAHPEMTSESEDRRRVEAMDEEIAFGMVWKGHVSKGRAAELLGKDISYVMSRLKGMGFDLHGFAEFGTDAYPAPCGSAPGGKGQR